LTPRKLSVEITYGSKPPNLSSTEWVSGNRRLTMSMSKLYMGWYYSPRRKRWL